jgi:hypothetical protein
MHTTHVTRWQGGLTNLPPVVAKPDAVRASSTVRCDIRREMLPWIHGNFPVCLYRIEDQRMRFFLERQDAAYRMATLPSRQEQNYLPFSQNREHPINHFTSI